jgi:ribonuclease HII
MARPLLSELRARVAAGPPYERGLLETLETDPREGARALYESCLRRLGAIGVEDARLARMQRFELEAAECGFARVAGVDEAGRGPLAGPIVAAAVVLREPLAGLNDSKQVLPEVRESLYERLMTGPNEVGVAVVSAEEIDRHGIQVANCRAMLLAAEQLRPSADFLLVDGFRIPGCPLPHRRIVKGDCRSLSIAAASIIAKVTRDRIMTELDALYPGYGFGRHKGYATEEHLRAIEQLGPCPVHRRSFAPIAQRPEKGWLFDTDERGG